MKKIGFIGYGLRSETMMKAFRALEAEVCVAAVADPRREEIARQVAQDPYFASTAYYGDAEEMLLREELDGVFIGTRCSLHTPYACKVLKLGLPLFLEKPVCTTRAQYEALRAAAEGQEKRVVVSFPLRLSAITLRTVTSSPQNVPPHIAAISLTEYSITYIILFYFPDRNRCQKFFPYNFRTGKPHPPPPHPHARRQLPTGRKCAATRLARMPLK